MTGMKPVLVGVAAVSICGCMGSGNFRNLPADEQALFQRCQMPVRAIRCPGLPNEFAVANCVNSSAALYAGEGSPSDRRRWLVENGCPPSMVVPEKFVSAEPPREAAPVASAPTFKEDFDPSTIHQLASTYDEFKDRTTTTTSSSLGSGLTLYLYAISRGRSRSGHVSTIRLAVSEESEKPKHLERPSLIFLVDGRRVIARDLSRHEAPSGGGRIGETISTSTSFTDLQMILGASKVRGQLDSTEFTFSSQNLADIRAFAERIGAVAPKPTLDGSEYSPPQVSK